MKKMYTVAEVAEHFGLTTMAVRHWIANGLPTETEKVIGMKPRMVMDLDVVYQFIGVKKGE